MNIQEDHLLAYDNCILLDASEWLAEIPALRTGSFLGYDGWMPCLVDGQIHACFAASFEACLKNSSFDGCPPVKIPDKRFLLAIHCTVCKVNPQLCFVLTKVEMCPDSYCINEVTNKEDGSKWVDRRCGTFDECENDWWHSTSDDPDCQDYKPDQNTLKDIHCTYCCTADNCNRDIKPAQDTLYMREDSTSTSPPNSPTAQTTTRLTGQTTVTADPNVHTSITTSAWSAWFNGQCSVTCGNGSLTRIRHCSTGHAEDCVGNSKEVIDCQKTPCRVDGVWSSWSPWSQCDVTCEDGHIYRTKTCTNPSPAFGGLNCSGASLETSTCKLAPCPTWSAWFNGQCSVTCGGGTLTRIRHCSTGHAEDCAGNSREVIECNRNPCRVDGGWSSWSPWSQCDVTCEDGHIQRTKTCTNPAPASGGLNCSGASLETRTCKLAQCPSWSEWFLGDCSVTCGNGTISRLRMCSSGHDEDCPGSAYDTMPCSQATC
ncbi:coadhesin-like [Dreissena polymorpha]|uniref:coadhesin-like n=1 Tax=Dreissena polymorpha TaxID=45954 RepID=UPI0022640DDC|nr:coadhesin-like [Dreissena polymorpha]